MSETFSVDVLANVPTVGGVVASPGSISSAGTDLLTLQAINVTSPAGMVLSVGFTLDGSSQAYLGYANVASNWTWSGYAGGLAPGTYTVSAVASSVLNGFTYYGTPTTTTLTVTAAPDYEPVVNAWTDQVLASPAAAYDNEGIGTTLDTAGNVRVFWTSFTSPPAQFVREFDSSGIALTGSIPLSTTLAWGNNPKIVGLPDGSFDEVYGANDNLYVQRYDAASAALGGPILVAANVPEPLFSSLGATADADAAGDLLIAYDSGTTSTQLNIYALTLSASGTVTRTPWLVNPTAGHQYLNSVALDASGAGVIAWYDADQKAVMARRVSGAGTSDAPSDLTVYQNPTLHSLSVAAGVDALGDLTLVYGGLDGIHSRHYGGDGATDSGDQVVYTEPDGAPPSPSVAVNAEGWAFVAWDDPNYGPNGAETLGKLIDPEGHVQSS
ncbi:MAG: hypothetical protein ACHRXM_03600 [Isosphaerales bacterium]